MKRFFLQLLAPLFAASGFCAAPVVNVAKPSALPLALDDAFQFRKTSIWRSDDKLMKPTNNEMINFERQRLNYGVISVYDRFQRAGFYYDFYWRTKRPADLTVRLEYRQQNLGSYVQAQERSYKAARGTIETKFAILGDEYADQGPVTAWRALLIQNGRIVAFNQSFLWD